MPIQTLPIQVNGAVPSAAPQRANPAPANDAARFSQALSREMAQRQNSPATAAPASAAAAPGNPPAQAPAKADGQPAAADRDAGADKDEAADSVDPVAANPVADMLAMVASFNQLTAAHKAPAAGGDGKEPVFKDAAQAIDVAAGPSKTTVLGVAAHEPQGAKAPAGAMVAGQDALPAGADAPSLSAPAAAPRAEAADLAAAAAATSAPLRAGEGAPDVAALKDPAPAAAAIAPAQQASLAVAQAVGGAPGDRITARVGTPGWDNQVSQKIVWMVAGKEQSATLTLNPPDLGPMQVVLNVTNDQASVTFTAAQPEVRQALENAMPKLREMMSESGIALGNASVNAGSPDQRQAQQGEQSRGGAPGARFGGAGGETALAAVTGRPVRQGGEGLVDTFA